MISQEYWSAKNVNNSMQTTIIILLERIVTALGAEFQVYLPPLIPNILRIFIHDNNERNVTKKVQY